jgi:TPR repeat protein
MWRGSAFSALMHGALFFALLFGLPALPEIFKRTLDREDGEVSISVEIVDPKAETGDAVLAPERSEAQPPQSAPEDAQLPAFAAGDSSAGRTRKPESARPGLSTEHAPTQNDRGEGAKQTVRIPSGRIEDSTPRAAQGLPSKTRDPRTDNAARNAAPSPARDERRQSPRAPAAAVLPREPAATPPAAPTATATVATGRPRTDDAATPPAPDSPRSARGTAQRAESAEPWTTAARPATAAPERVSPSAGREAQPGSSAVAPAAPAAAGTADSARAGSPAATDRSAAPSVPAAASAVSRPPGGEAAIRQGPASQALSEASQAAAAATAAAAGATAGVPAAARAEVQPSAFDAIRTAVDGRERAIIEQLVAEDRRLRDAVTPREDHPDMPASARARTLERLQNAANDGFPHAQFNLAGKYLRGEDVPRDFGEARKWLTKAAEQGYSPAQILVGLMHVSGVGLPRDLSETAFWWSLAAERGSDAAKQAAERLEPLLKPREVVRVHQLRAQWGSLIRDFAESSNQRSNLKAVNRDLQTAAEEGDLGAVLSMLARGADADSIGEDGRNAVLNAAWRGRNQVIRFLLQRGASTELTDEADRTPLLWAAINGHTSAASELISAGANPNHRDAEGMTPLIRAAWNGHEAVVRALLSAGAKVGARNEGGMTALSYAQREGHAGIVKLLRDAGAR